MYISLLRGITSQALAYRSFETLVYLKHWCIWHPWLEGHLFQADGSNTEKVQCCTDKQCAKETSSPKVPQAIPEIV